MGKHGAASHLSRGEDRDKNMRRRIACRQTGWGGGNNCPPSFHATSWSCSAGLAPLLQQTGLSHCVSWWLWLQPTQTCKICWEHTLKFQYWGLGGQREAGKFLGTGISHGREYLLPDAPACPETLGTLPLAL